LDVLPPQTEIIEEGFKHNVLNDEKMDLINQGSCHRGYFESSIPSHDFHNQYYFILKVLPALPVFLRKKLTYSLSKKIPYFVKLPIFIYSILYLGFIHKSPRIKLFFALYLKLMIWILKLKIFPKNMSKKYNLTRRSRSYRRSVYYFQCFQEII